LAKDLGRQIAAGDTIFNHISYESDLEISSPDEYAQYERGTKGYKNPISSRSGDSAQFLDVQQKGEF